MWAATHARGQSSKGMVHPDLVLILESSFTVIRALQVGAGGWEGCRLNLTEKEVSQEEEGL